MATATQPVHTDAGTAGSPSPRMYTCPQCENVLRLSGLGRHRIYFPLDDAASSDPVMNGRCPECGNPLPGQHSW